MLSTVQARLDAKLSSSSRLTKITSPLCPKTSFIRTVHLRLKTFGCGRIYKVGIKTGGHWPESDHCLFGHLCFTRKFYKLYGMVEIITLNEPIRSFKSLVC